MLKEEFCGFLGVHISDKDYRIIENVYIWHPIFENARRVNMDFKTLAVFLYKIGGLQIFIDLTPGANTMKDLIVKGDRYRIDDMIRLYEGPPCRRRR